MPQNSSTPSKSAKTINASSVPNSKQALVCEECKGFKSSKEYKYCRKCSKIVIKRLETVGYLQPVRFFTPFRPLSARENVHETKYGLD